MTDHPADATTAVSPLARYPLVNGDELVIYPPLLDDLPSRLLRALGSRLITSPSEISTLWTHDRLSNAQWRTNERL